MDRFPLPTTDNFQQVVFTPVGTIDVIALDRAARQHNARIAARGLSSGLAALRGATARMLHAVADRLEGRLAH